MHKTIKHFILFLLFLFLTMQKRQYIQDNNYKILIQSIIENLQSKNFLKNKNTMKKVFLR